MSTFLLLECSPHGERSLGGQVAREAIEQFRFGRPEVRLATRNVTTDGLRALSAAYAQGLFESWTHTSDAFPDSEQLIAELEQSAYVLISTPMHNFAVPSALKVWVDHVVRDGRTFKRGNGGKIGLLKDRPALVLVRSSTPCFGEKTSQPDFLTPYLRHVFSVMGIHSTEFVYLAGEEPTVGDIAIARAKLTASLEFSSRVFRSVRNAERTGR
ncbi:FMN-dependent NADH-azoreductase [Paraburkholderia terrae]|uniref:FMN-dependent NADH-azoreductase n=1 Tax=Paraburkholderia terrae TaxID=311230 RepID=UPI0020561C14|nr:NAD(P)H-dependent oxidoreductase [Paraburkholderia terrae]BDC45206.1 FMN-dependent NADH-azoreductase 1 [Paraburkholderia terrae]